MIDEKLIGKNYMQVFKPNEILKINAYFMYVDSIDDDSFRIFENAGLKVVRVESFDLVRVDNFDLMPTGDNIEQSPYRFTTCRINIKNIDKFIACMKSQYTNQLLTGGNNYTEVCKAFHSWLNTEKRFPEFDLNNI